MGTELAVCTPTVEHTVVLRWRLDNGLKQQRESTAFCALEGGIIAWSPTTLAVPETLCDMTERMTQDILDLQDHHYTI